MQDLLHDVLDQALTGTIQLGDYTIAKREILGNGFGLAGAILGMRRNVWTWPVGIIGNVLLFTVFIGGAFGWFDNPQDHALWGQAARQVFFILVSCYGLWLWLRNRGGDSSAAAVSPRWATARERTIFLTAAVVGVLVCWAIFNVVGVSWPAPWWYFLTDSWIFVGSVLATYAMARGWVDFWVVWLAVDLVGVPVLIYNRLLPSAALYAIYAGFVVWGLVVWLRVARQERPTDPVRKDETEAVPA